MSGNVQEVRKGHGSVRGLIF